MKDWTRLNIGFDIAVYISYDKDDDSFIVKAMYFDDLCAYGKTEKEALNNFSEEANCYISETINKNKRKYALAE